MLVVITIIGMLMSLLLPAVQSARETGRRATCMNNQYNLGRAALNYEGSCRRYPKLVSAVGVNDGQSNRPLANWLVPLFPFIDQMALWKEWSLATTPQSGPTPSAPNTAPTNGWIYLRFMVCQSDPPDIQGKGWTWSAYTANIAVFTVSDQTVSQEYIMLNDGTTTTLMFSENLRTLNGADWKAHQWTDFIRPDDSSWPSKARIAFGAVLPQPLPAAGKFMQENIRSNHGNGALATFCDGHVQFIRSDIPDALYRNMCSIKARPVDNSTNPKTLIAVEGGPYDETELNF